MKTKFTFDEIQQAFINSYITLDQLVQILVDNYGEKKTRKILRKNLELAIQREYEKHS
jgi:hypothetical protein